MGDYVGDITPHTKIQINRRNGGVRAHGRNITLAWFLRRDAAILARSWES